MKFLDIPLKMNSHIQHTYSLRVPGFTPFFYEFPVAPFYVRSVSCVPNVDGISGLSILAGPFDFSTVYQQ